MIMLKCLCFIDANWKRLHENNANGVFKALWSKYFDIENCCAKVHLYNIHQDMQLLA